MSGCVRASVTPPPKFVDWVVWAMVMPFTKVRTVGGPSFWWENELLSDTCFHSHCFSEVMKMTFSP